MKEAPRHVFKAALDTIKWATVYCRNYTLKPDADIKQINELMEAIHDIPDQLYRWDNNGLDSIRLHLRCFDHTKWTGSPNLERYFNDAIDGASRST